MAELSADDLNALFDAALEFGPNWRRPVGELVAERLAEHDAAHRADLAQAVEDCRAAIESHIAGLYGKHRGDIPVPVLRDVDAWIEANYPWMTADNRSHAISQGQYYAWRG